MFAGACTKMKPPAYWNHKDTHTHNHTHQEGVQRWWTLNFNLYHLIHKYL